MIAYDDTFSTLEPYLPREDDFRGASMALARLQKTYDIPLGQLINGIVAGRRSQSLSQREVLEIGLTAVSSNQPDDAVSWLVAGLNHNNSPLVNRLDFYHGLARAHATVRSLRYKPNYRCRTLVVKALSFTRKLCFLSSLSIHHAP